MSITRDNSVDRRRLKADERGLWSNARSRAATRLGWLAYEENRPKKTTLKASQMGGDQLFNNYSPTAHAQMKRGQELARMKALAS